VGKSTLFNAVTRTRKAEAANYPFCTIEPNVGIVQVPDSRLAPLAKVAKTGTIIPAAIEFVDIAGLVEGASQGEGLGNQFLSNIRQVDAIIQVVRCFEDEDIIHNMGSVDPVRDIEVITTELILADLQSVENQIERQSRKAKSQDKEAVARCTRMHVRSIPMDYKQGGLVSSTKSTRPLVSSIKFTIPGIHRFDLYVDALDHKGHHIVRTRTLNVWVNPHGSFARGYIHHKNICHFPIHFLLTCKLAFLLMDSTNPIEIIEQFLFPWFARTLCQYGSFTVWREVQSLTDTKIGNHNVTIRPF